MTILFFFSGLSLLQVTRSPLFCPCSCELVRLSHVPGFEAIFFPHIGPHDAAGFFPIGLSSEGGAMSSNQRAMYRRFLVKSGQRMSILGWNKVELRIAMDFETSIR